MSKINMCNLCAKSLCVRALLAYMRLQFTQIIQVSVRFLKSISQEKSTQYEKVCFIKEEEINVTQFELLSFFYFLEGKQIPSLNVFLVVVECVRILQNYFEINKIHY